MSKNTLIEAYDNLYAAEKLSFSDYSNRFPQHRNEAMVRLASSGHRVLEIGCGGGNVLYNLRERFEELYGIEISPLRADKVQQLGKQYEVNLQVMTGNIEEGLNFPDGFFDVILWADVIEHCVNLWSAMSEIKRLLANKGKLVTCTPNIAELRHRLTLLCGHFPFTSGTDEGFGVRKNELFDGGHLHYFTFSSLAKLYKKYDIEPVESLGFGRLRHFHNLYPSLLSASICLAGVKRI